MQAYIKKLFSVCGNNFRVKKVAVSAGKEEISARKKHPGDSTVFLNLLLLTLGCRNTGVQCTITYISRRPGRLCNGMVH